VPVLLTDVENVTDDQTPVKTSQTFMSALSDDTIGEIYRFSPLLQQSEDLRPSTTVLKNPMLSPGIKSGLHSTMEFLSTEKTGPHSARVTQTFAPTLSESNMALNFEVSTVVSGEFDPISPSAVQIPFEQK
jgi:hypothetical protein